MPATARRIVIMPHGGQDRMRDERNAKRNRTRANRHGESGFRKPVGRVAQMAVAVGGLRETPDGDRPNPPPVKFWPGQKSQPSGIRPHAPAAVDPISKKHTSQPP